LQKAVDDPERLPPRVKNLVFAIKPDPRSRILDLQSGHDAYRFAQLRPQVLESYSQKQLRKLDELYAARRLEVPSRESPGLLQLAAEVAPKSGSTESSQ
jgi:hypothetical protein